ncbi:MAG: substrate-binding periplasmic protein [Massilia sp.]
MAPKFVLDEGKRPQGLCPDIMAAIEAVEPRLRFTGFDRARSLAFIEDAMARGNALAACALVDSSIRNNVARRINVPLYEARYRLAAAAGDTAPVHSLDELARGRQLVNTARGSGYVNDLKARGVAVDDSSGDSVVNLRKTVHGHGRYTYLNEMSMFYYIRSAGLEAQLTVLPTVFHTGSLYFWVSRKADPALAPMLEAALIKLKANGELERISAHWSRLH